MPGQGRILERDEVRGLSHDKNFADERLDAVIGKKDTFTVEGRVFCVTEAQAGEDKRSWWKKNFDFRSLIWG